MSVAHDVSEQTAPVEAEALRSTMLLRVACFALLPLSVALWAIGVSRTSTASLGVYGLPAVLPLVFYAGIALLLVSAGIEFSRTQPSEAWLAAHAIALVVMLYGTAPLVYREGRYAWLYKTIGVVQYVNTHGLLDRSIDIYQNWPGFFALAAWFDKVAGVSSPLDYAKWAQLVFELAAIPLLYSIYQALQLPVWHRWLAIMLYAGSNWIAQDYFSPQGLSTLLSLGILAVVVRWMFAARPGARQTRESLPFLAVLVFLFFVLTESHELSPYIVTIQIAALTVAGLARPRSIVLVVAAITIGYLLPNFTFVNDHYGILSSIGNFFGNLKTPAVPTTGGLAVPLSHRIIGDCTALLSGLVWLLALLGAWLNRRSRRTVLALVLMTYTPVLVLVAGAYGNEGILRVYLFSLPWAAALAACALAPGRVGTLATDSAQEAAPASPRHGRIGRLMAGATATRAMLAGAMSSELVSRILTRPFHRYLIGPLRMHLPELLARLRAMLPTALRTALRAVVPLAVAVALFMPSFFGDDASNMMTTSEVQTLLAFQEQAKPGVILSALDNAPGADTANYNEWPLGAIFGSAGVAPPGTASPDIAAFLARTMVHYFGATPAYVLVSPSMIAYNDAFALTQPSNFRTLLASLAKSPYWALAVSQQGTVIYRMTPAATHMPSGTYASNHPIVAVP